MSGAIFLLPQYVFMVYTRKIFQKPVIYVLLFCKQEEIKAADILRHKLCSLIQLKYTINRNAQHAWQFKRACKFSVEMCEDGKTRDKPACRLEQWRTEGGGGVEGSDVKVLTSFSLEELTGVMLVIQFFLDSRLLRFAYLSNF
jgi:hypothetical protein